MSWLFSRALVEAFSEDTCLVGAPSVPSNENPTPLLFLPLDKMTDFSRLSRFGMTFAPLTENRGADVLTWFLEGFPARTSVPQARVLGSTASDPVCGSTWRELSVRYDPDTSSWKTARCSSSEDLPWSSVTLPKWGMTRSGALWAQQTLARPINATGSGLWPTPTVFGNNNRPGASKKAGWGLAVAARMWPTPNAGSPNWGGTMREWGGSKNWVRREMPELAAGPLNPVWVEWLMGWPQGWTDLEPLAMDRFQEWHKQHSESCPIAANDNYEDDADWNTWRAFILS